MVEIMKHGYLKSIGIALVWAALVFASASMASEKLGNAEVTLAGAIEEEFSGEAVHMAQELGAAEVYLLSMYRYESESDFTAVSFIFSEGKPEEGAYELREDEGVVEVGFMRVGDGATYVGSLSPGNPLESDGGIIPKFDSKVGELLIESVSGRMISGRVKFAGEMIDMSDQETALEFTLEAVFEAVAAEPSDLPTVLAAPGGG